MTLFIEDKSDGKYERFEECHYQRAYEIEEMVELVKQAGMEVLAVYDAFTKEPPKKNSERVYIVAKEQGKVN